MAVHSNDKVSLHTGGGESHIKRSGWLFNISGNSKLTDCCTVRKSSAGLHFDEGNAAVKDYSAQC